MLGLIVAAIVFLICVLGISFIFQPYFSWKKQIQSKQQCKEVTIHYGVEKKKNMSEIDFYSSSNIEISIVVPAYNEELRLPTMLADTITYLQKQTYQYEIIVVSDGSKDNTVQAALKFSKFNGKSIDLKVAEYTQNKGKGGAVRVGMMIASGKYLLMADADGATLIDDLANVYAQMKKIESKELGIVTGTRIHYLKEIKKQRKWYRNILMYVSHFVISIICGIKLIDTQCGFKLFTNKAAKSIFNIQHLQRWAFDVEIFMIALRLKIPVSDVPVNWQEMEGSKLNIITASITMTRDFLLVKFLYLMKLWKLNDKFFDEVPAKLKQN